MKRGKTEPVVAPSLQQNEGGDTQSPVVESSIAPSRWYFVAYHGLCQDSGDQWRKFWRSPRLGSRRRRTDSSPVGDKPMLYKTTGIPAATNTTLRRCTPIAGNTHLATQSNILLFLPSFIYCNHGRVKHRYSLWRDWAARRLSCPLLAPKQNKSIQGLRCY